MNKIDVGLSTDDVILLPRHPLATKLISVEKFVKTRDFVELDENFQRNAINRKSILGNQLLTSDFVSNTIR